VRVCRTRALFESEDHNPRGAESGNLYCRRKSLCVRSGKGIALFSFGWARLIKSDNRLHGHAHLLSRGLPFVLFAPLLEGFWIVRRLVVMGFLLAAPVMYVAARR